MIEGAFKFCLGEFSKHIYEALIAEIDTPSPEKGKVSLALRDNCIHLMISSETISGFRALSNSFILLIHAAYSAIVNVQT